MQEGEDQIEAHIPVENNQENQLDDIIEVSESQNSLNSSLNNLPLNSSLNNLALNSLPNREKNPHKTYSKDDATKKTSSQPLIKNDTLPRIHADKPPKNSTHRLIFNSANQVKIKHNLPKIRHNSVCRQDAPSENKLTLLYLTDILNAIEKAEELS